MKVPLTDVEMGQSANIMANIIVYFDFMSSSKDYAADDFYFQL